MTKLAMNSVSYFGSILIRVWVRLGNQRLLTERLKHVLTVRADPSLQERMLSRNGIPRLLMAPRWVCLCREIPVEDGRDLPGADQDALRDGVPTWAETFRGQCLRPQPQCSGHEPPPGHGVSVVHLFSLTGRVLGSLRQLYRP